MFRCGFLVLSDKGKQADAILRELGIGPIVSTGSKRTFLIDGEENVEALQSLLNEQLNGKRSMANHPNDFRLVTFKAD